MLLLTSRKFSLMTSRGNSCSMVTNNDDPRIVRADSMRASERGGKRRRGRNREGWRWPLSRARHLPAICGSAGRRPPWRRPLPPCWLSATAKRDRNPAGRGSIAGLSLIEEGFEPFNHFLGVALVSLFVPSLSNYRHYYFNCG